MVSIIIFMTKMHMLTGIDIAKRLNVKEETVRRWYRSGKIMGVKTSNKDGWSSTRGQFADFLSQNPKYLRRCEIYNPDFTFETKAEPCGDGLIHRVCNSCAFLKEGLRKEPCGDAVSREMAISVADYTDCNGISIEVVKQVTDEVIKGLKALPSVTPERQKREWIPVAEGLPEDGKTVLITDDSTCVDFGTCYDGQWYWLAGAHDDWWQRIDTVTAWMPSPEPYKEENK